MELIELNGCFVQPKAIFFVSADKVFDEVLFKEQVQAVDTKLKIEEMGMRHVIHVILFNQEKRLLHFEDEESRNARYTELVAQLQKAE